MVQNKGRCSYFLMISFVIQERSLFLQASRTITIEAVGNFNIFQYYLKLEFAIMSPEYKTLDFISILISSKDLRLSQKCCSASLSIT